MSLEICRAFRRGAGYALWSAWEKRRNASSRIIFDTIPFFKIFECRIVWEIKHMLVTKT